MSAGVLASTFVLWRSGELWPADWTVRYQQRTGAIWSAGIAPDERAFKFAQYEARNPRIIAMGSSRVLQIREAMFSETFQNMGRGLPQSGTAESYRALTRDHAPDLVLWGIDHYLFSQRKNEGINNQRAKYSQVGPRPLDGGAGLRIVPNTLVTLWSNIYSGKVELNAVIQTAIRGSARPGPRVGLRATTTNLGGYAPDGSYLSLREIEFPLETATQTEENVTRRLADRRAYQLSHDEIFDERMLAEIERTVDAILESGADLVIFLPPMHGDIATMLETGPEYAGFIQSVRRALVSLASEKGILFGDFLNPATIGSDNGEFYDPIHPTPKGMARLLLKIRAEAAFPNRQWIDSEFLENYIDHRGDAADEYEDHISFFVTSSGN